MQPAAQRLPDDPEQLRSRALEMADQLCAYERQSAEQTHALEQRERRIEQLLDYIQLLRQKRFGASTDRVSKDQLRLFDEAELEALLAELEAQAEQQRPAATTEPAEDEDQAPKRKPVRRPLPAHLKRVEQIIDLGEEEKQAMGSDWTFIGYDSAEQLAVIPRQYYVVRTKRAKYAPVSAEVDGVEQGLKIAPRAAQIIPKSIAHSSLLADVVTAKFVDGLPLYRQEKIFVREGIEISRQSMSSWIIQLSEKLLPLMRAMKAVLYQGRLIHIDETRLQVLNEPGREDTQKSYMWVYRGGPPTQPVVWFQYAPSRGGEVPIDFLFPSETEPDAGPPPECSFYIQTDGYSGYNALTKEPGVLGHAACWAHVRRKFVEATHGRKHTAAAHQMVALIRKLYAIERSARDKTPDERLAIRHAQSRQVIEKIKDWLDEKAQKVLPKGLLGQAIQYALGLWPLLLTFLEDGHVELDNNRAENAIRPFVVGRKNFLFSGSPRGAHASATLYSLIETAKANDLEPRAYLGYLFDRMPTAKTDAAIQALLPHNLKPEDLAL